MRGIPFTNEEKKELVQWYLLIGPQWEVMLGGDETYVGPSKFHHSRTGTSLKDCYRNLVKSGQFESKYIDIVCPSFLLLRIFVC